MANPNSDSNSPSRPQPTVSVVMSMRNAAGTVEQAIRSLQWQTLKDWELILLDDGSRDGSAQIAASFGDPRIRIQVDGESRGLAARLNQAVGLANAQFIARMDADDVCFPERLAKQVEFLKSNPSVDVAGCGAAVFSESGDLVGLLPVGRDHDAIVANPFRGFPLPHPTWCGRAAWFRGHPYNPNLRRAQDQDLLLRSFLHSSLAGLPDVLLGYRQERIDILKTVRGRLAFARTIWRHGRRHGSLFAVFKGIGAHITKAGVDIVLRGLGMNRVSQRLRLTPVPEGVVKAWAPLWAAIQSESKSPPSAPAGAASLPARN